MSVCSIARDDGRTPTYTTAQDGQVDRAIDGGGFTPTYTAAQDGQADRAIDGGFTPTYITAGKGQFDELRLLIDAKPQVGKPNDNGATPTCIAALEAQKFA